jgi:fucokinase
LSIQLDQGSTNTCIEQIFLACEDLIDGKFISGAGGGGFLQVILKKGITKENLRERLYSIFQDSGVDVWECELI